MKRFPPGATENWGAARKAINVFLENAFYDRFLTRKYKLERLEDFLELPPDSNVMRGLKEDGADLDACKRLPRHISIRDLKPKDNEAIQKCAKEVAKRKGIARIYLDLEYWRHAEKEEMGK
jgi:hypothetical protein